MSVLNMVLMAAAAVYFVVLFGRVCRLVWIEGTKGNEVDLADVLRMFGRDVWKTLTLPLVALKAARSK